MTAVIGSPAAGGPCWAAAALPPGALVADGVALVTDRLGDGDPDALAAQVMAETPDRFGRNWESGPAH